MCLSLRWIFWFILSRKNFSCCLWTNNREESFYHTMYCCCLSARSIHPPHLPVCCSLLLWSLFFIYLAIVSLKRNWTGYFPRLLFVSVVISFRSGDPRNKWLKREGWAALPVCYQKLRQSLFLSCASSPHHLLFCSQGVGTWKRWGCLSERNFPNFQGFDEILLFVSGSYPLPPHPFLIISFINIVSIHSQHPPSSWAAVEGWGLARSLLFGAAPLEGNGKFLSLFWNK